LASLPVKAGAERMFAKGFKFYRLAYNLLSLVFLAGIFLMLFRQQPHYVFTPDIGYSIMGYGVMTLGAIIIVLAFKNYDLGEFTGFKQLAQKIHQPEKLVITGINTWVRNPLYFGIMVLILGFFLQQPTWMNLVSLIIIYLYIYIGATLEERKLANVFGNQYFEYQKKVKMLIPFIF
jgi:protein-S-isoprenylcysteine O-methyltransferase Ste14